MKEVLYALALSALLTGCTTVPPNQAHLTVYSEPLGAAVYADKGMMGRTPVVLRYQATPGEKTIQTTPITVVWPSGAQATETVNLSGLGRQFHFTFRRPMNAPGLETDMAFDTQIRQQILVKQEQDRKDQTAAGALILGSMLSGYGNRSSYTRHRITCTHTGDMTFCD